MKNYIKAIGLVCCFFVFHTASAQKASPAATATGKIGDATISVNYSSPSVKQRKIWDGLVPYGKIWRAGANAVTTFETDKNLKIEGKNLPAGKYSIYILPTEKMWTIIFNSQVGQWGITKQGETTNDPTKDVLKVEVKPLRTKNFSERLVYEINSKGMAISWEEITVPVKIKK